MVSLVANMIELGPRLTCPVCLPLSEPSMHAGVANLTCTRCGTVYSVSGGVPILLSPAFVDARDTLIEGVTGRAMVEEYAAVDSGMRVGTDRGRGSRASGVLARFKPPGLMLHSDPDLTGPDTKALFDHAGPATRVLNLGGGPRRYRPTDVTLNLGAFTNVDVVGDAHCIPFMSNTFDSVICNAVLEHVTRPQDVVAEAIRVLRPGGKLYAEAPFIFFFHGYPSDFQRFTLEGMRLMFAGLASPKFGITNGPASAILQAIDTALELLIPPNAWALKLARGLFGWTMFPLKYLDRRINRREDAHILAGGFWVLGSKPSVATATDALNKP